jgi:lysozyme
MALPAEALDLIKSFEGYHRALGDGTGQVKPYLCPANVPTIGYGTTRCPDGRKVQLGDAPIDRDTAGAYIAHDLRQDETAFDRLTTVRLQELSRGALVSFLYNCGSGAYRGSTLRKCVNEGAWSDVPRELAKWRMGGGVVLAGLVRRRAAEADLFMRGVRLHNGGPALNAEPAPIAHEPEHVTEAPRQPWWQRVFGWWR